MHDSRVRGLARVPPPVALEAEAKKADKDFQARLKRRLKEDQEVLKRLAV